MKSTFTLLLFVIIPMLNCLAKENSIDNSPTPIFIENNGQIIDQFGKQRKDIDFKLSGSSIQLFIGSGQLHYQWTKNSSFDLSGKNQTEKNSAIYRMDVLLRNSNSDAQVNTEEIQSYFENYYFPTTPNCLQSRSYKKITYKNIYDHIDWILYINDNTVKYDFVVNPGGNIRDIQLEYIGVSKLESINGKIIAVTPFGSIEEDAPITYYYKTNKTVSSAFTVNGNTLSFAIPSLPEGIVTDNPLIIDPSLHWASYYGGSGNESAVESATDTAGNIYVVGQTSSTTNIATTGAHQTIITGSQDDGFVAKFDINGVRQWATYYGGSGLDQFVDIASDLQGNLYIIGIASSTGLATTGAHQTTLAGTNDALLIKLNSSGVRQWATYYGGTDSDAGSGVAINSNGDVYAGLNVGGTSTGLATTGAFQTTIGGGCVVKFNSAGVRQWATYINIDISSVCVDNSNNIYVTGATSMSSGVATTGAHQTVISGASAGALVKFNSSGARLWGTYYNGTISTLPYDVKCDFQDNVYFCGATSCTSNIASTGAFKTTPTPAVSGGDAFLVKFNSMGVRQWGTYFGGNSSTDRLTDLFIDSFNRIHLFGYTLSTTGITTANAYKASMTGGSDNMFITFSNTGQLLYASYFGGTNLEGPIGGGKEGGISYAKNKIIFCHATSSASGMPTTGSHQPTYGGGSYDGYIAVFNSDTFVAIAQPFVDTLKCSGDTLHIPFKVTQLFRNTNSFTIQMSDGSGSFTSPTTIGTVTTNTQGQYNWVVPNSITAGTGYRLRICGSAPIDTFYLDQNIKLNPVPVVLANNNSPLCSENDIILTASSSLSGGTWSWTGPASYSSTTQNPTRTNSQVNHSGDYIVTQTLNGCSAKDTTTVTVNLTPVAFTASNNGPLCAGSDLQLTATNSSPGAVYHWSGPAYSSNLQNPLIASVNSTNIGSYSVYATIGVCSTATSSTTVSILNGPVINIYPSPNDTICGNPTGSLTFNAVPINPGTNPGYQWYKNSLIIPGATLTTYVATGVNSGDIFSIKLIPGAGAPCATPVNSNNIPITVLPYTSPSTGILASDSIAWPGLLINFSTLNVIGGNTPKYQWQVNNKNIIGATSNSWSTTTLSNNDTVCVIVTPSFLCPSPSTAKACKRMQIKTDVSNTIISKLSVYPNPAKDMIVVKGLKKGVSLKLTDIYGRIIIIENAQNETEMIDIKSLSSGNYTLIVTNGGEVLATVKLVKS